jgi:hypothetical protein
VAGWSDIATPLHFRVSAEITATCSATIRLLKNDRKIIRKIGQKEDLLSIGLFDLWMAHEDRNQSL